MSVRGQPSFTDRVLGETYLLRGTDVMPLSNMVIELEDDGHIGSCGPFLSEQRSLLSQLASCIILPAAIIDAQASILADTVSPQLLL
jgi:hypothetical protein